MNTLRLEKMGCDFGKYSNEAKQSDLGNHRLYGLVDLNLVTDEAFKAKNPVKCGVTVGTWYYDSKTVIGDWRNQTKTLIEVEYNTEDGNAHRAREYCIHSQESTQKSVLETVNALFGTNYDSLEIVERGAAA